MMDATRLEGRLTGLGAVALVALVALVEGCTVGSGGDGLSAEDGNPTDSLGTFGTMSATDGASTIGTQGQDDDTGYKFDVEQDTELETATDGGPVLGSCRQSEEYGAAGGYPAFTDPAYADFLDRQVLLMTSYSYQGTDPELRVIDISGDPPPPNAWYDAPIYTNPAWSSQAFGGGIFGLTLDSQGNVYVASASVYSGNTTTPGTIYKIDKDTAEVSVFATLPNDGPALGNINYDCVSETIYASNHEDCRIYQLDMNGDVVSTYHHGTGDVTMGLANDPGEPNGVFCPLGDRVWAVQSHYGRLYYSVWWEDSGRHDDAHDNEIWSVAYVDPSGVPDPGTAELVAPIPGLGGNTYSNPVSDISFAASGWMLVSERTMTNDASTSAHQSTTFELQQMGNGVWQVVGETYVVGELPNSAAGGVDHDFEDDGRVWMTGDALDFYTPDVVYGVQGTPYGGGTIDNSTLIDHDSEVTSQDKTALGDCEIPIPGDAMPPPPPPQG
ncbi:MAG: hypothetical protein KDK70_01645 [Myxococcales bacterium]|nr:hypothetical protein [Myxococcales bacterium]